MSGAREPKIMLSGPVVVKQRGVPQHVSREEMLAFLDKFVQQKEDATGGSLALLKRIQRDFKGLPPQTE